VDLAEKIPDLIREMEQFKGSLLLAEKTAVWIELRDVPRWEFQVHQF
jgi:hypothetical protein